MNTISLFERADKALNEAKDKGKGKCVVMPVSQEKKEVQDEMMDDGI
jgi:predicted signal transduction protein with EAL and GGDEF domain